MDNWFETLNPDEKLLWLYLLTNPMSNMLGLFEVSIKRMSTDTGISQAKILTIMKDFQRLQKAFYWFGSVFLPNWMKHQSMNPNMVKSAISIYAGLSNELNTKLIENGFESFERLSKGCQMLPKIEIESKIEKESVVTTQNFYKSELEKSNGDVDYKNFVSFLYGKSEYNNEKCINVLGLKEQLTYGQFQDVMKLYYSLPEMKPIRDIVLNMENKKDLQSKYKSFYRTLHNWVKIEGKQK